MNLNDSLKAAINDQITMEHRAALVYTQLAYDLDEQSFEGMSTWMMAQAEEERVHAEKFARHLLARGARVELQDITAPTAHCSNPLEAFEAALAHERNVSESIRNIARIAEEVSDFESRTLINWFLDEQIEEEDTVGGIVDRLRLIDGDGPGLLRIDGELGAQRSAPNAQEN